MDNAKFRLDGLNVTEVVVSTEGTIFKNPPLGDMFWM